MQIRRQILSALALSVAALVSSPAAQTSLPLVTAADMTYQGAFRLPDGFEYAAFGSVFNPARQSLIITGKWRLTAEITIPTPSRSTDLAQLPTASFIRPLTDASEGTLQSVGSDVYIGGYLIYQNALYFGGYVFYDASGSQRLSHWRRPVDLSVNGQITGPFGIVVSPWNITAPGLTSGPMTLIPQEWRTAFGGPTLIGQCCIPILSRTSYGPAAVVWDPAAAPNTRVHDMLLYYTQERPLAPYEDPNGNDLFSGPTQVHGMVFPDNTRSVLYFGRHGTGPFCYGDGVTQNPPPPPQTINGVTYTYCYDPAFSDKGNHTYPYHYQVWAYDANDLLAVKNGSKKHYEPKPYAWWRLNLPFKNVNAEINGTAWDPATRRLFITQAYGDGVQPIIYVYQLGSGGSTTAPSIPTGVRIIGS